MNIIHSCYRKLTDNNLHGYDPILLGATALLCLVGVLMIYSASSSLSDRLYGSSLILLRGHLVHLVVGLLAMMMTMRIPYTLWKHWVPFGLALCLVLLVLVLIPGIGHRVAGASRWLRLGPVGFQPSELLKFVLIAHVAFYLTRKQHVVSEFVRGMVPSLAVMALFLGLVLLQPDFGTVVLVTLTLLLMIFSGGARLGHVLFSFIGFGLVGVTLIASQTYRVRRLLAFLDPWQDRLDTGFQIIQSYLAFGNGGWSGVGLGASRQKMFFLPEAHTDFIFSILAEEAGVLGSLGLILLLGCFIWRSFAACLANEDEFGRYLGFGIATLLGLQILLNLAVVMGMMPTKGLPLPFISYGGSSVVMTLVMTGILLNIGRQGPRAASLRGS